MGTEILIPDTLRGNTGAAAVTLSVVKVQEDPVWLISGIFPHVEPQQALRCHRFPWRSGLCFRKVLFTWKKKPGICPVSLWQGLPWAPPKGIPFPLQLPHPPLPTAPQSVKLFFEFELKPFQTYF